jgi:DNA recombination protein RmuC
MNLPVGIQLIIAAIIGGALGILFGWLKWCGKSSDSRLENVLQEQIKQREAELDKLRGQISEAGNARAAAEAKLASTEKMLIEQRALQDKALIDLREAFKALSADALKQLQPEFLERAKQTFAVFQESAKGDLSQRHEAIKGLVEPLKQQLETYQKHLETLAQSNLSLAAETQQFRMVLKSNQARGRWGEETLRRVVEAAGMSAHCDFSEQTQAGDAKPDLIVRLPGERFIIVDAKVPDFDFLNALESADETKRAEALAFHAAKLKATIKALADRDYPSQFPNALDYVVLFIPAESLFSAALEGDHDLIVWAAGKRILLATPASLIALLRSVSVSWQQHAQTENAQKIAEAAQEFFARVVKFTEHFEKIRNGLERANSAFNDAAASFQTRIRPAGERLAELGGAASGKELTDIQPLDSTLRLPPG